MKRKVYDNDEFDTTGYKVDSNDEDGLVCGNCDSIVECESDLFYHDGDYVCESCLDSLRRIDEIEYQEWERDDFNDYD